MHFGQYIKNKRSDLGWTQPDAAAKIGIEQSYLSKLETGKSVPSDDIFNKMKAVYEIDLDDMAESVIESDLIKLNEVKSIKATVHAIEKKRVTATRSWLVAGLLFLILGGSFLGAVSIPGKFVNEYSYLSQGILLPGEEPSVFSNNHKYTKYISGLSTDERGKFIQRIKPKYKTYTTSRGASFLETDTDGLRYYELKYNDAVISTRFPRWFVIPAFAFLIGGLGCFFIATKWRKVK